MKSFHLLTPLILLAAAASPAEEKKPTPMSLAALVAQAIADNPELNFYRAEIGAAAGERKATGAWANPEVTGELGRKRTTGPGLSAEGTAWSVSVSQTFEWPGRVSLRKAIADRQVKLAEVGLE